MLCRHSLIFNAFPSILVCDLVLFFSIDLWVLNIGILLLPLLLTLLFHLSCSKGSFWCVYYGLPTDFRQDKNPYNTVLFVIKTLLYNLKPNIHVLAFFLKWLYTHGFSAIIQTKRIFMFRTNKIHITYNSLAPSILLLQTLKLYMLKLLPPLLFY